MCRGPRRGAASLRPTCQSCWISTCRTPISIIEFGSAVVTSSSLRGALCPTPHSADHDHHHSGQGEHRENGHYSYAPARSSDHHQAHDKRQLLPFPSVSPSPACPSACSSSVAAAPTRTS